MAPPPPPKCGGGVVRTISQAAFDDLVRENIEDLGMDPAEALQDAIDTLTLQEVDLSGIVTCVPGEGGVKDNPVMRCLEKLKQLGSELKNQVDENDELVECFEELSSLCSLEGSGNVAIATRNGGVELVCLLCGQIKVRCNRTLNASLKALAPLLNDIQTRELFKDCHGPKTIVGILDVSENLETFATGFSVVAMAATANEILKESFMELKIDELIIRVLTRPGKHCIQSVYDAIRVLLAADDNRVVASQVYGYARRFAKVGIAVTLVDSLHEGISSPSLVSACIALKAVAVNVGTLFFLLDILMHTNQLCFLVIVNMAGSEEEDAIKLNLTGQELTTVCCMVFFQFEATDLVINIRMRFAKILRKMVASMHFYIALMIVGHKATK